MKKANIDYNCSKKLLAIPQDKISICSFNFLEFCYTQVWLFKKKIFFIDSFEFCELQNVDVTVFVVAFYLLRVYWEFKLQI